MILGVLLAHVAARWAVTRDAPTHGWVPDESETEMNETAHQHCAICDWLSREAERTASDLGRTAWISETGSRANPREHWARYEQEEA